MVPVGLLHTGLLLGFPGGSVGEESPSRCRRLGSIPDLERSPGEGNDHLLQYSCLGNPWTEEPGGLQSTGLVAKSRTELSEHKHICFTPSSLTWGLC